MVNKRNIFLVYLFSFITFGIYGLVWMVKTKNEMNGLGAKIPTAWLLIVPIANLFWYYKYSEGFSQVVKKDSSAVLWFILWLFVTIVMPGITQAGLNGLAGQAPAVPVAAQAPVAPAQAPVAAAA